MWGWKETVDNANENVSVVKSLNLQVDLIIDSFDILNLKFKEDLQTLAFYKLEPENVWAFVS